MQTFTFEQKSCLVLHNELLVTYQKNQGCQKFYRRISAFPNVLKNWSRLVSFEDMGSGGHIVESNE